MARYRQNVTIQQPAEYLGQAVSQYLSAEGYIYKEFDGEKLWKKGNGLVAGPTFIKITFNGSVATLEAWIKYALLPGVYIGEMGITGFFGYAQKSILKDRVMMLTNILTQPYVPPQV